MRPMILIADEAGRYVDWGVIQISVTNLAIIGAMIVVFVLALVLPFPGRHHPDAERPAAGRPTTERRDAAHLDSADLDS